MMYRVRVLRRAQGDIEDTYAWLSRRSPAGALRWYGALWQAIAMLESRALMHGLAPESQTLKREIRQAFFKSRRGRTYRLLYAVVGEEVRVLRVRGPGQPPVRAKDVRA